MAGSGLPLGGGVGLKHGGGSAGSLVGAGSKMPEYVRRAMSYPQMDIDYTFWQMLYLCISPSRVYRTTKYHRQTKNQWARDDPAFVAILVYFMAVASLGYSVAFHKGAFGMLKGIVYSISIDFALVGVSATTVSWWVANAYLRTDNSGSHTTEQRVEWMYAFDVHCNSFLPLFMALYVLQFLLLPFLLGQGFVPLLFSNTMYCAALSYYFYVTFLGFDVLPFLQHTAGFLYPIAPVVVSAVVSTLLRVNMSRLVMESYFGGNVR